MNKRLLTAKEMIEYTGLGRNRATDWGKEIGVAVRIGGRVMFDRVTVDKAITEILEGRETHDKGISK